MFQPGTRGQVGVGTVIAFIAMAMTAAIAAGVLTNVGGLLEAEAAATADDSSNRVSDRLQVVSVTGGVSATDRIDTYNFTLARGPGSGEIRIENVSFELIDSVSAETSLVGNGSDDIVREVRVLTAQSDDLVITDKGDRYIVSIDASNRSAELGPGESAVVTLTTAAGASTRAEISAPESLASRSEAKLYYPNTGWVR